MTLDKRSVQAANEQFSDADVLRVIEWAKNTFSDELGMTTAFGYSGIVLLHHVIQIIPNQKIYFIDTGFHFPETLQFCEWITNEWNLNLEIIRPAINREELYSKLGKHPYKTNADLCCKYCKVDPLLKILRTKKAWLSAIRRDQSRTRNKIKVIHLDRRGVLKIAPLANWSRERAWNYIKNNNIPYHPLHDNNYPSIGCAPCTSQVVTGNNERAGRWPFIKKLECGIHLNPQD